MQPQSKILKEILLAVITCMTFYVKSLTAQPVQTIPASQLVLPKNFVLEFRWQGDSVQSGWEPNAAILIPVKIKNCPREFYMQFDLGSPYSLLYKNKLKAIRLKYPEGIPPQGISEKLQNFAFTMDRVHVLAKDIIVKQFDNGAIDWNDKNSIEIIGTIGTDLIDGRVVVIDYPNSKLSISQNIPEELTQRISLTDFIYSNRSVLLPVKVKDKEIMLYFDTGSSMFEVLSDKATCNQLAVKDAEPERFPVKSWDKELTANMLAVNTNIAVGNTIIPLRSCTYMEGVSESQVAYMSKMGIGGMVGNKLFVNHILVLDTQHKKFGLTTQLQQER